MPIGRICNNREDLLAMVPCNMLFPYMVDLQDIREGFVYLVHKGGNSFLYSEYAIEEFEINPSWRDEYIVDDNIIILFIQDQIEKWRTSVNEIGNADSCEKVYRIGSKCGFYTSEGLNVANYYAISLNRIQWYRAIAHLDKTHHNEDYTKRYNYAYNYSIKYSKLTDDHKLIKIPDNWENFNPYDYKWFPYTFYEKYLHSKYYDDYNYHSNEYQWTDEDVWDAMTDGMYGDYPGGNIDYEIFGF